MFILSILEETTNVWVGGRRLSDDSWIWLDGTEFSYTNWATGEPNSYQGRKEDSLMINCGLLDYIEGWNDEPKYQTVNTNGYLCQYKAF